MTKIKIIKDKYKDNPEYYSIENMIGKVIEVESIDEDGDAVIKTKDGFYTDIFSEEFEIVGK
jgi:hypothetical protein